MTDVLRLTDYARGGGCACKIPPGELEAMVAGLGPASGTADLLVGLDHGDDAAVVRLDERTGLVSTVDFFTPLVDDARTWGAIAAANAASDVYAMGGRPLFALNVVAWPRDRLPLELLGEVLAGGEESAAAGGWLVVGGHTVDGEEPIPAPARRSRHDAIRSTIATTTRGAFGLVTSSGAVLRLTPADLPSVPPASVGLTAGIKVRDLGAFERGEEAVALIDLASDEPWQSMTSSALIDIGQMSMLWLAERSPG